MACAQAECANSTHRLDRLTTEVRTRTLSGMTKLKLGVLFGAAFAVNQVSNATADDAPPPSSARPLLDRAIIDHESGVLAILQNDGRYGAQGTEYTARDTNQRKNLFIGSRLSLELGRGRHTAVLLYAPLDVTTRATLSRDLQFRDALFAADTPVDHRYLFDGYRASYLYQLTGMPVAVEIGGSVQIRNAKVAFSAIDGSTYAEESDIGVVGALKVRARYRARSGLYALLDADGLSTFGLLGDTEGGIYDVALTLGLPVFDAADVLLRFRALGGGATVPDREIENWAHFISFTAGIRIDLTALR